MAEKFCKYFVFRDEENGVLSRGLALIHLDLYEAFYVEDPESGRPLFLDHLCRHRLISIDLDINNIRCHRRSTIQEAVHPLLIDMGVPEHLQEDILQKITLSLTDWSKSTCVPPIKVYIGVGTDLEDYELGADANERPRLIDSPYGTVTAKIDESGAKVACGLCSEFTEGTSLLTMPCSHAFHESCIMERVLKSHSSSCPLCR